MLNTCVFDGIRNILSLLDRSIVSNTLQPEVLHAEDAIYALERRIKFSTVIHVSWHDFCTERFQFLRGRLVDITRQCAYLPLVCQKLSGHRASLLTGCTGDCNNLILHFVPLLWFSIFVFARSHSFHEAM